MQRQVWTGRPVVMASRGMVAAPHYLAAEAGVWALQQGGNAVDAALAAGAALAVVYPHMAGLGGDAFVMVWEPGAARPLCLNGSGHAGSQATPAFYRDRGHATVPQRGPLSSNTVPGTVAAWGDLHRRWGALPWAQLLEPAIHYAEAGFAISSHLAQSLERQRPDLERHDATRTIYLPGGRLCREGELLVQADLAQTLSILAEEGSSAFYQGDLAEAIVSDLQEHGGLLTLSDLADHHSDWVDPLEIDYRGRRVYEFPPNTPGAIALLMLNLLAGYDLRNLGSDMATFYHLLVEAAKCAEADLGGRIGDPNYVGLPLAELLSPDYAAQRRALIDPARARPPAEYAEGALLGAAICPSSPAHATACVAAADRSGLVVSLVQSLHGEFGSGFCAACTGVLLGNAGAAFSLDPESPNRLEPQRRPLQPLMPGMVAMEGRAWLAFGASGGAGEPQIHVALLSHIVDEGCNLQQAIEAPRWLWGQPSGSEGLALRIEGRVSDAVLRSLRELGHEVKVAADWSELMGQAQAILIDVEQGVFHGAADPRGDGQAIGW